MKLNNINKVDLITGAMLFLLSVFLYFFILPNQIEDPMAGPLALSPALFCKVITILLIFLNFLLVVFSIFGKSIVGAEEDDGSPGSVSRDESPNQKRVVVMIIVTVIYILVLERIGFFVSTAAVLLVLMTYFKHGKWSHQVLMLAIVLSFIYLLFVVGLKVMLPAGLLI